MVAGALIWPCESLPTRRIVRGPRVANRNAGLHPVSCGSPATFVLQVRFAHGRVKPGSLESEPCPSNTLATFCSRTAPAAGMLIFTVGGELMAVTNMLAKALLP